MAAGGLSAPTAIPRGDGTPAPRIISGGVVAHNDEGRIHRAVQSLLDQELPDGVAWGRIWVVASGCTDRTVEVAQALAEEDERLQVLVEPERHGKAAAIRTVLARAEGESVVLLNSDAVAAPGAIAALLKTAEGKRSPYAVMGRPVVPAEFEGSWAETMRWMWELHHALHVEFLAEGRGAHLSDELLLLSLPAPAPLGEGIINDGSFLAVWLSQHDGGCWYAPEGAVGIDVPNTVSEFLGQRRRIHAGNVQVRRLLGRPVTTLPRYFLQEPSRALKALQTAVGRPSGTTHLLRVGFWEVVARGLATWDLAPPARDHVRWKRIHSGSVEPSLSAVPGAVPPALADPDVHRSVDALLTVAADFRTGVPLDRLTELLPSSAPATTADLARWLEARPGLARLEEGDVYRPEVRGADRERRRALGHAYHLHAERLCSGTLRFARSWLRCVGVSGSAAYGEPVAGDDLDFFVVTRTGSVWWFLAMTYAAVRLRRLRGEGSGEPEPCFNYVLDDSRAPVEFESGRGFLFAREALTVQMIDGDPYYRGLLARAAWMRGEIPRLYAARSGSPEDCQPEPASRVVRMLNALVFVPLAAYLHLVGLWRNARLRREGRAQSTFRTRTGWHRLALSSERFEALRQRYDAAQEPKLSGEGWASPSALPSCR